MTLSDKQIDALIDLESCINDTGVLRSIEEGYLSEQLLEDAGLGEFASIVADYNSASTKATLLEEAYYDRYHEDMERP